MIQKETHACLMAEVSILPTLTIGQFLTELISLNHTQFIEAYDAHDRVYVFFEDGELYGAEDPCTVEVLIDQIINGGFTKDSPQPLKTSGGYEVVGITLWENDDPDTYFIVSRDE